MNNLKKIYTSLFAFIIAIVLFVVGLFISNNKIKNNDVIDKYTYDGDINYVVNLKNNGGTSNQEVFVSNSVDSINLNFNYKYTHNNTSSLKYKYEIIASVVSNIVDESVENSEVYRKEEILVTSDYKEDNIININENVSINYDYYNNIALKYDESVNVEINSKLMVILKLYVVNDSEESQYSSSIILPLEKSAFTISKSKGTSSGDITGQSENKVKLYINVVLITLIAISFGMIVFLLIELFKYKEKYYLEFKYKKIMKDYDNLIAPISKIPKSNDIVMIKILYFKSMIDIQKELHIPILCYKGDEYIVYMIINNNMAYVYFLNEEKEKI